MNASLRILLAVLMLTLPAAVAAAADVQVLAPGGAAPGVRALATEYNQQGRDRQGGTQVVVSSIRPALVRQKIFAGEPYDMVVQAIPAMAEAEKAGLLQAGSRIALARGGIGVIVRKGAPVPDVSTVEGFRRAMLAAHKVIVGELAQANGAGPAILSILEDAGVLDAVKSKWQEADIGPGNALIAKGDADVGLFNLVAVPYEVGVVLAGPVPQPLQRYTSYEGAVLAKAAAPDAAVAFIRFMASGEARGIWTAKLFEPLPAR
jgi:molybdate transport system substrate-binding protein